jgi:hypothetical protein
MVRKRLRCMQVLPGKNIKETKNKEVFCYLVMLFQLAVLNYLAFKAQLTKNFPFIRYFFAKTSIPDFMTLNLLVKIKHLMNRLILHYLSYITKKLSGRRAIIRVCLSHT